MVFGCLAEEETVVACPPRGEVQAVLLYLHQSTSAAGKNEHGRFVVARRLPSLR